MSLQDKIWNLTIEESKDGTIYYPNGAFSVGYTFPEEKLQEVKKLYIRTFIAFFVILSVGNGLFRENFMLFMLVSLSPWLYYKFKISGYIKNYGTKTDKKMGIKNYYDNLGDNIGGSALNIMLVCSAIFLFVSIFILFKGSVTLPNVTMVLIGAFLTVVFGYCVRSHDKKYSK